MKFNGRRGVISVAIACGLAIVVIGCGGGGGGGTSTASTASGSTSTASSSTASTSTATTSTSTSTTSTATTSTGTTSTGSTTPGVLPQNVIVFGYNPNPSASPGVFNVEYLPPTGGTPTVYVPNVPLGVESFSLNPIVQNQWVFAMLQQSSNLVGIYSNTTLSSSGASTLVAPTYTGVQSLSVTQDGKYIVYTAYDQSGNSNLYVLSTSGGAPTMYDTSYGSCVSTANPDLVYFSKTVGTQAADQIFVRSISAGAAGAATQLTTSSTIDKLSPAISRDGKLLAYIGNDISGTGNPSKFSVQKLSGGAVTTLPNPSNLLPLSEAFNSDGTSLAELLEDGSSLTYLATQTVSSSSSPSFLISSSLNLEPGVGVYWTSNNGRAATRTGGLLNALASHRKLRQ